MDGCSSILILGLAVAAFVVALLAKQHAERIARELAHTHAALDELRRELKSLRREDPSSPITPPPPPEVAPATMVAPSEPAAQPPVAEELPPVVPAHLPEAYASAAEPPPPPPSYDVPPPPPPAVDPGAVPQSRPAFDWENLVGVKLFSWIAGIALALAGVFFLKYSVDHGWLTPALRVVIGLITGAGVIAICELRIARNYRFTANAMDGAGVAILYATLFAAHSLWKLVPQPAVFAGMVVVTALAVYLSARRDSVFIALLGLLGGFATPALLSTGENRPIALFGYLLLLNLGIAWVAYKRGWPVLSIASAIFTFIYQWAWVTEYLTDAQMPLAAGIFAVFALAGGSALWVRRADESLDEKQTVFERIALATSVVPLFFAVFAAAVPAYGSRYHVLFAFLLLINAALAVIAILRKHAWLNTIGGIGALLAFAVWLAFSYASDAWPAVLVWMTAAIVLHLVIGHWLSGSTTIAALLLFTFPALAALEPAADDLTTFFGFFFALAAAVLVMTPQRRRVNSYGIASLLTTVTLLTWAVARLSPESAVGFLVVIASLVFVQLASLLRVRSREHAPRNPAVLALGAYMSLLYFAGARTVAEPITPLLIALAAVAIAFGIASILLQRVSCALGAAVMTQLVLIVWSAQHGDSRSAAVIVIAASVGCAAAALGWFVVARGGLRVADALDVPAAAAFAGLLVVLVAERSAALPPPFVTLLAGELLLASFVLAVAFLARTHALATAAALAMVIVSLLARDLIPLQQLIATGSIAALFTAYPIVVGAPRGSSSHPYIAAVVAHVLFLFAANDALTDLGATRFIGLLSLAQAAVLYGLLVHLLRTEPVADRLLSRLALVAGAVLAFVTVAIPLQFEREWLTLGWVLLATALIWLYRRISHGGLLAWSGALYAIVFARLVLNSAVFEYHTRTGTPVWNWYLYAYLLAATAFYAGARLLPATMRNSIAALTAGGTVLLFILVNIEIADFYSTGATLAFNFFSASLAEDLSYTIAWALFAIAVLVAGIAMRSRGARIAALALLAATILKCFVHDLGRLGGLYRVGSLLGLAASLVVVGLLIQRFVIARETRDAADPA